MQAGDRVLVLGAGPIGLAVAFWAKRMGAKRVVVQDVADWQRTRALEMGADGFIAEPADPVGASDRAFAGSKPDLVFECVGVPGLIAQAVRQVRNRGRILLLGLCTRPDTFDSFAMLQKEVTLVTSAFFTRQDFEQALDALGAGAIEPRLLVTGTISLDETPAMFDALKHRTHQCKVLIAP
jgi:(R,R)-butanediol dehydrogenase/meso-butanediol dehydrogenase/diacetyl reductase